MKNKTFILPDASVDLSQAIEERDFYRKYIKRFINRGCSLSFGDVAKIEDFMTAHGSLYLGKGKWKIVPPTGNA